MGNKIKNRLVGIKIVFSNRKYLVLFISMIAVFSFAYIFAWNLVLIPNFYIRTDLWTPLNILSLVIISVSSSMAITLGIFNLKMKIATGKGGFFAVIPAFLTSACPGCVPLILSFTSTTFAIGLSLAQFGFVVKIFTTLLLLATVLYMSSIIGQCEIKIKKKE